MTLDGARVYFEGVKVNHEYDEKIRQIVSAVQSLSPSFEVSMRFLRKGNVYEGLLWGKASDVPIGVYNRGPSMTHVLETLYRKVKRQSRKVLKTSDNVISKARTYTQNHSPTVMAG